MTGCYVVTSDRFFGGFKRWAFPFVPETQDVARTMALEWAEKVSGILRLEDGEGKVKP